MATISEKLDAMEADRVALYVRGDRLFVEGLARVNDPELPGWIRKHKSEIMEEVRARDHERSQGVRLRELCQLPGHCTCCGGVDFWENNVGGWICRTCHPKG